MQQRKLRFSKLIILNHPSLNWKRKLVNSCNCEQKHEKLLQKCNTAELRDFRYSLFQRENTCSIGWDRFNFHHQVSRMVVLRCENVAGRTNRHFTEPGPCAGVLQSAWLPDCCVSVLFSIRNSPTSEAQYQHQQAIATQFSEKIRHTSVLQHLHGVKRIDHRLNRTVRSSTVVAMQTNVSDNFMILSPSLKLG